MRRKLKHSELQQNIPDTVITSSDDGSQTVSTIHSPMSSARKKENLQAYRIWKFTQKIKAGWEPEDIVASFQQEEEEFKRNKSTRSRGSLLRRTKSENNVVTNRRVAANNNRSPRRMTEPPRVVELSSHSRDDMLRKSISFRKRDNSNEDSFKGTLSTEETKTPEPDFLGEVIVFSGKQISAKPRDSRSKHKRSSINASISVSNTTLSTLTQDSSKLPEISEGEVVNSFQREIILPAERIQGRSRHTRQIPTLIGSSNESISISNTTFSTLTQESKLPEISEEIVDNYENERISQGGRGRSKHNRSINTSVAAGNIPSQNRSRHKRMQQQQQNTTIVNDIAFENINLVMETSNHSRRSTNSRQRSEKRRGNSDTKCHRQVNERGGFYGEEYTSQAGSYSSTITGSTRAS